MTKTKQKRLTAIDKARQVNLIEYCQYKGIDLLDVNSSHPKMAEHDSLVFFPDNIDRQWHRYSTGQGGDSIEFVRFLKEKEGKEFNFGQAIKELNEVRSGEISYKTSEPKNEDFIYDTKQEREMNKSKSYLINERKINPGIIQSLINHNLISENQYNSVIYKWVDPFSDGKIVGASEEGISLNKSGNRFKKIQHGSETGKGFNVLIGEPKTINFFESPADLMSYMSLDYEEDGRSLDDTWYISMEGLKDSVYFESMKSIAEYKKTNPDFTHIEQVKLCVDNDEKGQEFAKSLSDDYIIITDEGEKDIDIDSPDYAKDWNDCLKDKREQEAIEKELDNDLEI